MTMLSVLASPPNRPKVKIIAVAKDEAAYFPEWVHHHLYFGFDAIEIHINRTTDNSAQVLEAIADKYPNVTWQCADWVDMCPGQAKQQIQFIVYAKALQEVRESGEFTHVLFLDIDEFWCSQDYSTNIQDCISSIDTNSAIFFEWINDLGNLSCFSNLPSQLQGNLSPLGKTLLPVNIDIIELRHHVPLFRDKQQHILVDGQVFTARAQPVQALEQNLNYLKSSFIYHRAHRSEIEYVSLLYRGRPGNNFKFKNNRMGMPKQNKMTVTVPAEAYARYQLSFVDFNILVGAQELLDVSREFVLGRYLASIENIPFGLQTNYDEMKRMFNGVAVPEVIVKFTEFRKKAVECEPNNVALIREYAKDAASQDIDEAIFLMKKAQKLRPKGPVINSKLLEFEQIKLKKMANS